MIVIKEEKDIQISIHSDKKSVLEFLETLHKILSDKSFDIDTNLILIKKDKIAEKKLFSTPYTIEKLEYDHLDIVERLKELTINEYSETKFDVDDDRPPLLFVFGKNIKGRLVYIKLKIKGKDNKKVLCLSFHFAEKEMRFPYA